MKTADRNILHDITKIEDITGSTSGPDEKVSSAASPNDILNNSIRPAEQKVNTDELYKTPPVGECR